MRRFALTLAAAATIVLVASIPAGATDITGVLVDYACYANKGGSPSVDPAHARCAMQCAQHGQRLALVTATGNVYLITGVLASNDNALLLPLLFKTIVVSGTVTQQPAVNQNGQGQNGNGQGQNGNGQGGNGGRPGGPPPTIGGKTGDFREGDPVGVPYVTIDSATAVLATIQITLGL